MKIDNDVKSEESNEKSLVIAKVLKSNENTNQPPNQQSNEVRINNKILNPPEVVTKGRKKIARKKSFTEIKKRNQPRKRKASAEKIEKITETSVNFKSKKAKKNKFKSEE